MASLNDAGPERAVRGRAGSGPGVAAVVAVLALFALVQAPDFLGVPLVGDDYIVLDKTRDAGLASVWAPRLLISHYYRPWSRELHFWLLQHLFGLRAAPFHLAGAALWLAVFALYFALVRRLAGTGTACLATAAAGTLAGWGLLLVWTAGAQDLWMLLFALLFLHALERGRAGWASAALVLALLSKETAALLPALALAHALLVARLPFARALRRVAPMLLLLAVWAALHPLLGGRFLWPHAEPAVPGLHPPLVRIALRTLLALFNLEIWPRPEAGWLAVLPRAVAGALLLGGLAAWGLAAGGARAPVTPAQPPAARVAFFGAAWALLGWLPLLMPTLGWHAYYALLGALGAWLALAVVLAHRWWAGVAVVAALAVLRTGLAATPAEDWGTEWFQRRAATFTARAHEALLGLRPALPRGSRVYLAGLPGGTGLVPGHDESPVLRVWYRDPALRVAVLERYRRRAAGDTAGIDVFFRFDFEAGWREVAKGAEDLAHADASPRWRVDHERLAVALSRGGDWAAAAGEYVKLAEAFPGNATYPYYAGLAFDVQGDSLEAARWLRRAVALPAADEEVRAAARALAPRGSLRRRGAEDP